MEIDTIRGSLADARPRNFGPPCGHRAERSLIRLRCGKIVRTQALDRAERNRNGAGVDGPDPETNIDGPRLRVSVNPRSLTVAAARNARMDHANGE